VAHDLGPGAEAEREQGACEREAPDFRRLRVRRQDVHKQAEDAEHNETKVDGHTRNVGMLAPLGKPRARRRLIPWRARTNRIPTPSRSCRTTR
jgi:hypothetical protein